jgi:general secretion pathway protein A
LKSSHDADDVFSALKRVVLSDPDTSADADMKSVLAEIDAAMARSAAAEKAAAAAPTSVADVAPEHVEAATTFERDDIEVERADEAIEFPSEHRGPEADSPFASDKFATEFPSEPIAPASRPATIGPLTPASGAESRSRLNWFIGAADVTSADPGSLTYEPHFGLREKPFSLSSDPRFFFGYPSHLAAFDTLAAGIRRREGLLVLTGEVGVGKTTLCRAVLQSLDQKTFAALVPDPFLSREDLLKTLLVEFGVVSVEDVRNGRLRGASRSDLSYPLYDFLASLQPLKAFAVVMIDEAQNLTPELLEEIRILADLENGQKLLEVVLVGQPELQARLATTSMRQIAQRVSIRCELSPIAREQTSAYVAHRLTIAGNDGRVRFSDAAIDLVAGASNGIPRVINLVCDRALQWAAHQRQTKVDAEHVTAAIDDLKLPPAAKSIGSVAAADVAASASPHPSAERSRPSDADEPGDPFNSFLRESRTAAAARQSDPPAPLPKAVPSPVVEASAPPPLALARGRRSSRIDLSTGRRDEAEAGESRAVAGVPFAEDFGIEPRRRPWLMPAAVAVGLIVGAAGYWLSKPPVPAQQPSPALSLPVANGGPIESSLAASSASDASAPPSVPADTASPVRTSASATDERVATARSVGEPGSGFAVQMATFKSETRAEESVAAFRDAGLQAFSVEKTLADGTRAFAILLGPYADRSAAEQGRDRAQQVPGYGTGLIVQVGSATSSPGAQ